MKEQDELCLQAYLNREQSSEERKDTAQRIEKDEALQGSFAIFQTRDQELKATLQHLQQPSPHNVHEALQRFHQQREAPQAQGKASQSGSSLREWFANLLGPQTPVFFGGLATAAAACVLLFSWGPDSLVPKHKMHRVEHRAPGALPPNVRGQQSTLRPTMRAKSAARLASAKGSLRVAFLYTGIVGKDGQVKRIGAGERCRSHHQLLFALKLKRAGYPYLLLREGTKGLLLYPFAGRAVKWKAGYQEIQRQRTPQKYSLQRHKGTIEFVLLWSQKPLPASALSTLQAKGALVSSGKPWKAFTKEHPSLSVERTPLYVQAEAQPNDE